MKVLLAVSTVVPGDLARRVADDDVPRPDYAAMADAFPAEIVDAAAASRAGGALARRLARVIDGRLLLAWGCFRRRDEVDVVFTDGEHLGIPYALLCRAMGRGRARHLMIGHRLSAPKKAWLWRAFRLGRVVDVVFVYADQQRRQVVERLGVEPDRVVLSPFMVDTRFFRPTTAAEAARPRICAVGQEHRDFATLCEAVDGLDVTVVIAAGSPWSKQPDLIRGRPVPDNVEICRLDYAALRDLYASSQLVVVPLFDVDFQAGVTTVLEAMAMGKPVVRTATSGRCDAVVDGITGRLVPPGDPRALRHAIVELLADSAARSAMGEAGRAEVERRFDVEHYAVELSRWVHAATDPRVTSSGSGPT